MSTPRFDSIRAERPSFEQVQEQYRTLHERFDAATNAEGRMEIVRDWDRLRREVDTWESLTHLHFAQDTTNEAYQRELSYRDELSPKLTDLSVAWKRKLLETCRDELTAEFGDQVAAIWESDISTFAPAIESDLVEESKVSNEYTALLASAELQFDGKAQTLSELRKYREHPDRELRHGAELARWSWYDEHGQQLDELFDRQVRLRDKMARTLGDTTFIELGYRRMMRIDYSRDDVDRFRDAVRQRVTPLCAKLVEQQRETLGLAGPVMFWDEDLLDPAGNPAPHGEYDWLIERATKMFDAMGHSLDSFFRMLEGGGFMDLKSRSGKAGGGFCTSFANQGQPFIFANFNGTKADVEVFTHEVGHAFQNYVSRNQPLSDYLWPTYESCEIHSMGLEFLTWPHMEQFFEADAERFRRIHLEQSLRFLPYGVAIDHFQHLVYERPEATPAERHAMWREMEQTYLPWRNYGDLPHVSQGGFWQQQRHIYLSPFYYIDYTLALTCAMQLWVRSESDYDGTMRDYVALCQRGGEAPFRELAQSAGLRSPFEPGCLDEVVEAAEQRLAGT
ncbi:MAG: M3 family oligoendopeptidase [Planctomycetales bacterium]|nr:M3 family oligoendopeptidase [Planctomycetales bacterium]